MKKHLKKRLKGGNANVRSFVNDYIPVLPNSYERMNGKF